MPWSTDEDVAKHKKGLNSKQSAQWRRIANSVLKKELAKGKSEAEAAASAIRQANGVVNANVASALYSVYKVKQSKYEPKLTVHQDKAHIVIPVTMMVEGVHNGSQGPLLHTIEELGKFPASWDGRPVVIYHPTIDDVPVSANSPDIIDTRTVGRVYNTNVEGKKLKAEVWLDEDKLNSISEETLNNVNSSNEMEVSLGMFTENEMVEGDYEDEHYVGIAHNHRPDHLAILPDQIGACSREKGCGLGVNEKTEDEKKEDEEDDEEEMDGKMKKKMKMNKNKQEPDNMSGKLEGGSPVEVHEDVAVNSILTRTKFNNSKIKEVEMAENAKCTPCVEKKVNELIANSQGRWTDGDREWLLTLEEKTLDRMMPIVIKEEVIKEVQVNALTDAQKAALAFGERQLKEKRDRMIEGIQANAKGIWQPEELNAMTETTLEKVFNSIKKEEVVDYSLNGTGFNTNISTSEVDPLLPTGVVETKK